MKHFKIRQAITDRSSESVNQYLKDIKKYPLLTDEEEKELVCNLTDENKKKLIESNLRFVISIAKQYQGKGIELADLIAVGNTGLIKAIEKFNPDAGCKFISYAVWWIRQSILEEIMTNGKTIKVPINKVSSNIRITKAIAEFEQIHGYIPTDDDISEMTGISPEDIKDIIKSNVTILNDSVITLDGEEESIFDSIILDDYIDPEYKDDVKSTIRNALSKLNPIEQTVLKDFFGFNGEPKDVKVIAEDNNITTERVRQIKDKAIIKLRKSSDIGLLNKYLGKV